MAQIIGTVHHPVQMCRPSVPHRHLALKQMALILERTLGTIHARFLDSRTRLLFELHHRHSHAFWINGREKENLCNIT